MKKTILFLTVFTLCILKAQNSRAMGLNEYLEKFKSHHKSYLAAMKNEEVVQQKKIGADIELNPIAQLKIMDTSDKKQPNQLGSTETKVTSTSVSYSQKIKTGTDLQVSAAANGFENKDLSNPLFSAYRKYSQGALGISLQQALWKNGFGSATRLRQQRDLATYQMELTGIQFEKARLLVEAEQVFWDSIYLNQEVQLKKDSLARAQQIVSWMKKRLNDGIADEADYLNAQSLVEARTLELISSQDELRGTESRLRDEMGFEYGEPIPTMEGSLGQSNPEKLNLANNVLRFDAMIGFYEVELKKTLALERRESFKPELNLLASYSTNSFESGGALSEATQNITQSDTPTYSLGLNLTYQLDTDIKKAVVSTAQNDLQVSQFKFERLQRDSNTAWQELHRRYQELSARVAVAQKLSKIQERRAQLETQKLSRGRSITSQVIAAEQDADEAAVRLNKLYAEQHKLESQAQLFTLVKE